MDAGKDEDKDPEENEDVEDVEEDGSVEPHYALATENWEHHHQAKEIKKQILRRDDVSPEQRKAFRAHSSVSCTRTPSHLSRAKLATIKNKLKQQTYTGTGRDVQQLFAHFDLNHGTRSLLSVLRRLPFTQLVSPFKPQMDTSPTKSSLEQFVDSCHLLMVKSYVCYEYSMSNRTNGKLITDSSHSLYFRIILVLERKLEDVSPN